MKHCGSPSKMALRVAVPLRGNYKVKTPPHILRKTVDDTNNMNAKLAKSYTLCEASASLVLRGELYSRPLDYHSISLLKTPDC